MGYHNILQKHIVVFPPHTITDLVGWAIGTDSLVARTAIPTTGVNSLKIRDIILVTGVNGSIIRDVVSTAVQSTKTPLR